MHLTPEISVFLGILSIIALIIGLILMLKRKYEAGILPYAIILMVLITITLVSKGIIKTDLGVIFSMIFLFLVFNGYKALLCWKRDSQEEKIAAA